MRRKTKYKKEVKVSKTNYTKVKEAAIKIKKNEK